MTEDISPHCVSLGELQHPYASISLPFLLFSTPPFFFYIQEVPGQGQLVGFYFPVVCLCFLIELEAFASSI